MFNSHLHAQIAELKKQNEELTNKLASKESALSTAEADARSARQALSDLRNSRDLEKQQLQFDLKHAGDTAAIAMEHALQDQARKMSEALIKSDISREQALAKLAVYEKMDTKADANTIKEMVGKLIDAIGKANVNLLNK